jgi:hypothetical protein
VQFRSKPGAHHETWVSNSVKKKITVPEGKEFLAIYRSGLYGYTYLVTLDKDVPQTYNAGPSWN